MPSLVGRLKMTTRSGIIFKKQRPQSSAIIPLYSQGSHLLKKTQVSTRLASQQGSLKYCICTRTRVKALARTLKQAWVRISLQPLLHIITTQLIAAFAYVNRACYMNLKSSTKRKKEGLWNVNKALYYCVVVLDANLGG